MVEAVLSIDAALNVIEDDARQPPLRHAAKVFNVDCSVEFHTQAPLNTPVSILALPGDSASRYHSDREPCVFLMLYEGADE
jgi:hypothetical protein